MSHGFLPRTDNGLLQFAKTFSGRVSLSPELYGLTQQNADDLAAATAAYADAIPGVQPQVRNQVSVSLKNQTRAALRVLASSLGKIVKANLSVSDQDKIELGLNPDAARSATPVPADSPSVFVMSVQGRSIRLQLTESIDALRARRPRHAMAAMIYTYVGDQLPPSVDDWKMESVSTSTTTEIALGVDIEPGSKVWLSARWIGTRGELGPMSTPLATHTQFGGVEMSRRVRRAA